MMGVSSFDLEKNKIKLTNIDFNYVWSLSINDLLVVNLEETS